MHIVQLVFLALTGYLSVTLLASGLAKVVERAEFARVLAKQGLWSERLVRPIAAATPLAEVVLAIWIAFGVYPVIAGALAVATFGIFLALTAVLAWKRKGAECGCFGVVFHERVGSIVLVRDLLFVAIAGAYLGVSTTTSPSPRVLYVLAGVAACVVGVWCVLAPAVAARTRRWRRGGGTLAVSNQGVR